MVPKKEGAWGSECTYTLLLFLRRISGKRKVKEEENNGYTRTSHLCLAGPIGQKVLISLSPRYVSWKISKLFGGGVTWTGGELDPMI